MARILHLSDLHYGKADTDLEEPLLSVVEETRPDLVVISGDLTQRARWRQFARARAFIERIDAKVLCVPGNHDTPLDNIFVRMFRPFGRYRTLIDETLEPMHEDANMMVAGINTVNRFAWQRGQVSARTVRRVCSVFDDAGDRLRVAVMHHPLEHGPDVDKRLASGAQAALQAFSDCGVDVVLSGHLHYAVTQPFTAAPGLLFVQAGTGLSTRLRGEANMVNLIEQRPEGGVSVTAYRAEGSGTAARFEPAEAACFKRSREGWLRDATGDAAGEAAPLKTAQGRTT